MPEGRTITEEETLDGRVDAAIEDVRAEMNTLQRPDGHWVFELEADATIPAEYILLRHFLAESEADLDRELEG